MTFLRAVDLAALESPGAAAGHVGVLPQGLALLPHQVVVGPARK